MGSGPRLILTSTPKPGRVLRGVLNEAGCVRTDAPTSANADNLAPGFLAAMQALYGGTRRAAQELDGLNTRLTQPPFVERWRAPLRSTDSRLRNVDLVVFENVGVPAPNPDARLALDLPLAGMQIDVRLGDLLDGPAPRKK